MNSEVLCRAVTALAECGRYEAVDLWNERSFGEDDFRHDPLGLMLYITARDTLATLPPEEYDEWDDDGDDYDPRVDGKEYDYIGNGRVVVVEG